MFGFKEEEFFEVAEAIRDAGAPQVDFSAPRRRRPWSRRPRPPRLPPRRRSDAAAGTAGDAAG